MKKNLFALAAIAVILFTGCSKDDSSVASVTKQIGGTSWVVTYYWDKDKDETYKFQNYTFAFSSGSVAEALQGGNVQTGTWVFDTSDDSHDHFIINFPVVTPLDDLNDDWHVVKITDSVIELKDESGSGGTEYLTFKKN
ncbi:MAG TPA: hypothetical protein P5228_00515 [Bacteroidales bacterium]|nr:hypothetical protein [Bacteroidales bacterium]HRZ48305.1 hypothetical protein [Bacteroidales bacterium]